LGRGLYGWSPPDQHYMRKLNKLPSGGAFSMLSWHRGRGRGTGKRRHPGEEHSQQEGRALGCAAPGPLGQSTCCAVASLLPAYCLGLPLLCLPLLGLHTGYRFQYVSTLRQSAYAVLPYSLAVALYSACSVIGAMHTCATIWRFRAYQAHCNTWFLNAP